jgi:hypothetical protein
MPRARALAALVLSALQLACVDPRQSPISRPAEAGSEEEPPASRDGVAPADVIAADAPVAPDAAAVPDAPPAPDTPSAPDTAVPRDTAVAPAPDGAPACGPGTHRCGQACLRNDDLASCGQRCEPCPNPAPGTVACLLGVCQVSCPTGYHECEYRCVSSRSPATCGDMCYPCEEVPNGDATCDGVACATRCRTGFLTCPSRDTACLAPVIGFESASEPQFVLGSNSLGVDPPVVSTKQVHSGTSALMQAIRARAQAHNAVRFCPPQTLDLIGKRLSLWYYFDGTPPPGARIGLGIAGGNAGTSFASGLGDWAVVGQRWTKITSDPIDYPPANHTGTLEYDLYADQAPTGYSATLYVDDVAIE